jgi:hypothetical protein
MKTLNALRQIEPLLASNPLPKAARAWGGADMAISPSSNQDVSSGGFYPAPRCVVTTHTLEVSWLFEALRDAFYAENRLDGQTKIEFFGRLANAANRCLKKNAAPSAQELCAALLERVRYGCEIGPAYCDVILRRIMNMTGETATLAETGETFPAAAESRGVPVDGSAAWMASISSPSEARLLQRRDDVR